MQWIQNRNWKQLEDATLCLEGPKVLSNFLTRLKIMLPELPTVTNLAKEIQCKFVHRK